MDFDKNFHGIAFGLMDGLILVLGLLIGVSVATGEARLAVLSGVVGGVTNAFGNAIGFYTSESAERGKQLAFYSRKKIHKTEKYLLSHSGILESTVFTFIATLASLALPIAPFFIFKDIVLALVASFSAAVILLFLLGLQICRINKCTQRHVHGAKFIALGLGGAIISFLLGEFFKAYV